MHTVIFPVKESFCVVSLHVPAFPRSFTSFVLGRFDFPLSSLRVGTVIMGRESLTVLIWLFFSFLSSRLVVEVDEP